MFLPEEAVQRPGGKGKKPVVEPDDFPQGPVIGPELIRARIPEFFLQSAVQQVPVRSPPPVNRLLDIPDDEVSEPAGLAVFEQRAEILPLDGRGILELVEKEILETHAQFLIDEGGVASVDDIAENLVRIVDAEDVFLALEVGECLSQCPGDTEPIKLFPDEQGGFIFLERQVEKGAEGPQGLFQLSLQGEPELIFPLREPFIAVCRFGQERGRRFIDGVSGRKLRIFVKALEIFAVGLLRVDSFR